MGSTGYLAVLSDGPIATRRLGSAIAALLVPGDVVVLTGELGAGKTLAVQAIAAGLGVSEQVTSPTFALMQSYAGTVPVHHLDVYRVGESIDADALDLSEVFDGESVVLIEWGERIARDLPRDRLELVVTYGDDVDDRIVEIRPHGHSWAARSTALGDLAAGQDSPC